MDNTFYVRAKMERTGPQIEGRRGDGLSKAVMLSYPLAERPAVILNGNAQTVGVKGVDTGYDWYWAMGDALLVRDRDAAPLGDVDSLTISYVGQYPVIVPNAS